MTTPHANSPITSAIHACRALPTLNVPDFPLQTSVILPIPPLPHFPLSQATNDSSANPLRSPVAKKKNGRVREQSEFKLSHQHLLDVVERWGDGVRVAFLSRLCLWYPTIKFGTAPELKRFASGFDCRSTQEPERRISDFETPCVIFTISLFSP